ESEVHVHRPEDDGRMRSDKGDVQSTAEQPDGPDGPTVVEVDDGSGEPTTYTLGDQDDEGSQGEGGGAARRMTGSGGADSHGTGGTVADTGEADHESAD